MSASLSLSRTSLHRAACARQVVASRARVPRSSVAGAFSLASRTNAPWIHPQQQGQSIRFMSTSSPADRLTSLLRREYDEEMENSDSTTMPPELSDLQSELQDAGWKVVSHGATTKLIRTLDDASTKVQISFHAQDSVMDESRFLEELDGEPTVDDDEEEMPARVRFTAVVTKAGKHMVFTCISEDAQAVIENVAVTTTTSAMSVDDILKAGSVDEQQYQGPEFGELAEDLQESFHAYLQEHVGIGESVASFICMYADYREQSEYVEFLQEAQNVLK